MSNLIKYPFVNMQGKEKVLINYEKEDKFVPLEKKSRVFMRLAEEVEAEEKEMEQAAKFRQLKGSSTGKPSPMGKPSPAGSAGGAAPVSRKRGNAAGGKESLDLAATEEFEAGVPVVNYDDMLTEKIEGAERQAEQIVAEAREQAAVIQAEAQEQAEAVRQEAREEGFTAGREEGLAVAGEEAEQVRQELAASRQSMEQEFDQRMTEAESRYVDILCSLVQKLTGVMLNHQKDVLLHLIRHCMADIDPSEHYTVHVSSEDLVLVESHREEIMRKAGTRVSLDVQEEKELAGGECIIETDKQMVDCGFHTQLDNLVNTLRMLVPQ